MRPMHDGQSVFWDLFSKRDQDQSTDLQKIGCVVELIGRLSLFATFTWSAKGNRKV